MPRKIKIGTRDSKLALWQANQVKNKLQELGLDTELVYIKTKGDLDLNTPLNQMQNIGIFTKALDDALLNNEIDIAVHSCKDLPTTSPDGLRLSAVLSRHQPGDLLVYNNSNEFLNDKKGVAVIATGSIRRKAQWLNRYPNHNIENLRGNVITRLEKLNKNNWNGAVFAKAGLDRLGLVPKNSCELDWMLPAPAQGVIATVARADDQFVLEKSALINHDKTFLTTKLERDFLRTLEGGCSAPIGALAIIEANKINFKGILISMDGKEKLEIKLKEEFKRAGEMGIKAAESILKKGGDKIMESIRKNV